MKHIAIAAAVTLGLAACAGTGNESPTASVKLEPRSGSKVGGTLTLTSSPSQGTEVRATVPVESASP